MTINFYIFYMMFSFHFIVYFFPSIYDWKHLLIQSDRSAVTFHSDIFCMKSFDRYLFKGVCPSLWTYIMINYTITVTLKICRSCALSTFIPFCTISGSDYLPWKVLYQFLSLCLDLCLTRQSYNITICILQFCNLPIYFCEDDFIIQLQSYVPLMIIQIPCFKAKYIFSMLHCFNVEYILPWFCL